MPRPTPGLLAAAPLLLAAAVLGLVLEFELAALEEAPLWTAYLYAPVGVLFVGAGAVAMARRPTNRIGVLLALTGVVTIVSDYTALPLEGELVLGLLVVTAPLGMIAHLLHAFPSGRLPAWPERLVVGVTYLVTLVSSALEVYLLRAGNPLSLTDAPGAADVFDGLNSYLFVACTTASAVVLFRRLRELAPERRRVVGPLYLYGILTLLMFSFAPNVLPRLVEGTPFETIELLQLVAAGGVPVAFVVTIVRGGYARTEDAVALTARLAPGAGATQDALARGLGDPSVVLHERVPDRPGPGRGLLPIAVDGRDLGAIEYDATLMTDRTALQAAGALVAVSQERARLNAELASASGRMVEAADRERARIARDLHDGLQARLVLLALEADGKDDRLRDELNETLDDLRAFVQGIMPAGLIEQGLEAAVEDLADRLPVACEVRIAVGEERLPPAVESTAYFVVAEGVANAVKHARAGRLEVTVTRDAERVRVRVADDGAGGARAGGGIGLTGLADRVAALGGALRVESPPGAGTLLEAVVPCAS